jgi:GR25 family glycosyltransferase involved in LPS biosynthesis
MRSSVQVFALSILLAILCINGKDGCTYAPRRKEDVATAPEIFWINMDRSVDRRVIMQQHMDELGHLHRRVPGLSPSEIYIPEGVRSNWDKASAVVTTTEVIPSKAVLGKGAHNYSHALLGLVGRKKNNINEVGCTSSHLEAIRQAIYNNRSSSRYAVIVEDDVTIPFDIDFDKLVASAPEGFKILQLFNSNEGTMKNSWEKYGKNGFLWSKHFQHQIAAFWSTCAYLIDREALKPVIDKIAYEANGWVNLKLAACLKKPCHPLNSECCVVQQHNSTELKRSSFVFTGTAPCIWSVKGYMADSFIYALGKTYVLSVPLITNGASANTSTFHQEHVEMLHRSAFSRQRKYINAMIVGDSVLPPFAKKACALPLPL